MSQNEPLAAAAMAMTLSSDMTESAIEMVRTARQTVFEAAM